MTSFFNDLICLPFKVFEEKRAGFACDSLILHTEKDKAPFAFFQSGRLACKKAESSERWRSHAQNRRYAKQRDSFIPRNPRFHLFPREAEPWGRFELLQRLAFAVLAFGPSPLLRPLLPLQEGNRATDADPKDKPQGNQKGLPRCWGDFSFRGKGRQSELPLIRKRRWRLSTQ